jgi:hypothetical protein
MEEEMSRTYRNGHARYVRWPSKAAFYDYHRKWRYSEKEIDIKWKKYNSDWGGFRSGWCRFQKKYELRQYRRKSKQLIHNEEWDMLPHPVRKPWLD